MRMHNFIPTPVLVMCRGLVSALISLHFCFSIAIGLSTRESAEYAVTVNSQQTGIKVTLILPSGSLSIVEIDGYSLPMVCSTSRQCNMTVQSNGTAASVLIPLERGVAYISYIHDPVKGHLVYNDHHIIAINRSCSPSSISFTTQSMAFLLCMNLTGSTPFLDFMSLDLGSGNDSLRQASYLSTWNIYNSEYFSESLYVPDQANCPKINPSISSNIFVMDDLNAVAFITSPNVAAYVTFLGVLPLSLAPLCPEFFRLEYYGNNKAIMRCSNASGIIHSLCAENAVGYDKSQGIPFPCSDWSTVITLFSNGSIRSSSLPSMQMNLPYPIADALCINGKNPAFVFALGNGTVLALAVYSGVLIEVTKAAAHRQGRWFSWSANPSIIKMDDGQIFMVVEAESGDISIKNLTFGEANLSTSFTAFYLFSISQVNTVFNTPTTSVSVIIAIISTAAAAFVIIVAVAVIITVIIKCTRKKSNIESDKNRYSDGNTQQSMQEAKGTRRRGHPDNTHQELHETTLYHEITRQSLNHAHKYLQDANKDSHEHTGTMMPHSQTDADNRMPYGDLSKTSCEPLCTTSSDGISGFMSFGNVTLVQPHLIHQDEVVRQNESRMDTDDKRNDYVHKARTIRGTP